MQLKSIASPLALATALLLGGCAAATSEAPAPATGLARAAAQVPTQLPRNVRPLHYRIAAVPDPANLRFSARTDIQIEVLEPTDSITLNAADLEIGNVSIGNDNALALNPAETRMDAEQQTATFRFPRTLEPGRYLLTIDYTGKINTQAAGLFALD